MANKIYKSIEEVSVWSDAHKLALQIHRETKKFPKDEIYGNKF